MVDTTDENRVPRHLAGTPQFPDATDLSDYIVHLTSTAEKLANTLVTGCIGARAAHGLGRKVHPVRPLRADGRPPTTVAIIPGWRS